MADIAKIWVSGMIDENCFDTFRKQLQGFGNYKAIEVNIDSFGGYVYQGRQIHTFLEKEKARGINVTTIGWAFVMSSATLIFSAGQERILHPFTEFVIHLPRSGDLSGLTADELEIYLESLRKDENDIANIYEGKTGITKAELLAMMQKDETWSAQKAFELGFATKVEGANKNKADNLQQKAVAYWSIKLENDAKYTFEKRTDLFEGTMQLERKNMPQIQDADMFKTYLIAKFGRAVLTYGEIPAGKLKPTQRIGDFDKDKVWEIATTEGYKDNELFISYDNEIIDRHHRWAGALENNTDTLLKVCKIDLSAKKIFSIVKNLDMIKNVAIFEPSKINEEILFDMNFILNYESNLAINH
jgi:ATP-dependent protease ClpP protease subunit